MALATDPVRTQERRLERVRSLIAATAPEERALRVALVLVHETLRERLTEQVTPAEIPLPRFDAARWGITGVERISAYEALVGRIRERMAAVVPPGAAVAVVSRGDDGLLELDGRVTVHFPQDANGRYAGYYPRDARGAIEQLRELRSRGMTFLLFPATAFWWLDFYSELARWLAPAAVWSCEDCAVYEIGRLP